MHACNVRRCQHGVRCVDIDGIGFKRLVLDGELLEPDKSIDLHINLFNKYILNDRLSFYLCNRKLLFVK